MFNLFVEPTPEERERVQRVFSLLVDLQEAISAVRQQDVDNVSGDTRVVDRLLMFYPLLVELNELIHRACGYAKP